MYFMYSKWDAYKYLSIILNVYNTITYSYICSGNYYSAFDGILSKESNTMLF